MRAFPQVQVQDLTLKVRRVSPEKAMSSEGAFGQIFQLCLERVANERLRQLTERERAEVHLKACTTEIYLHI